MIDKLDEIPGMKRFVSSIFFSGRIVMPYLCGCRATLYAQYTLHVIYITACIHLHIHSQDVPNHQSFTVLFKYFGGGEVEFTPLTGTSEGEGNPCS